MKMNPRKLAIADFSYELPEERIAAYPLEERDASRLLVYKDGLITETTYRRIANELPKGALMVFNNTRVVQARLLFQKPTGGQIEIFCLEPDKRYRDISTAMTETGGVSWTCLVGGAAKWKTGQVLAKSIDTPNGPAELRAAIETRHPDGFTIRFEWSPTHLSFAEILHLAGKIPIPPYIKREADETDSQRYQTIYAEQEGSVAAPTAGLHFTPAVFESLQAADISHCFLTLHVGAGTFKPVKSGQIEGHEMHAEFIDVDSSTITRLLQHKDLIIAVGTTSLRTLESLYWMGVKAKLHPDADLQDLSMKQWEVYDHLQDKSLTVEEALTQLLNWMHNRNMKKLVCKTQIMIAPGYEVKMARAIITNFHQPQSTLLLLVSALIGDDWKNVYAYALENGFRFLSYGDGSLLWKK